MVVNDFEDCLIVLMSNSFSLETELLLIKTSLNEEVFEYLAQI